MHEFFTADELEGFLEDVQKYVLPNLDGMRERLKSSYDFENDPDNHVDDFVGHLDCILEAYPDWPDIENTIHTQRVQVDDWVSEVSWGRRSEPATGRSDLMFASSHLGERSIFEDVDL